MKKTPRLVYTASVQELIDNNEVRLAGPLELFVIRARISLAMVVITAGSAYAAYWLVLHPISWLALLFVCSIPMGGLAINLSYHAYFSHSAFTTGRAFKIFLAILGVINFRGPVVDWVAHHRRHHKYTDIHDKDPHSPWQFGDSPWAVFKGLCWVFVGEKMSRYRTLNQAFAEDLLKDRDLAFVTKIHDGLAALSLVGPGLVAYALFGDLHLALVTTCVLGCLRAGFVFFVIAVLINGLCHLLGNHPFRSENRSRNIPWLSLFTFGGSLHHNHHVFPKSLYVGLNGEFDPFDYVYKFLEVTGIIWNVRTPGPQKLDHMRTSPLLGLHSLRVAASSDDPHQVQQSSLTHVLEGCITDTAGARRRKPDSQPQI